MTARPSVSYVCLGGNVLGCYLRQRSDFQSPDSFIYMRVLLYKFSLCVCLFFMLRYLLTYFKICFSDWTRKSESHFYCSLKYFVDLGRFEYPREDWTILPSSTGPLNLRSIITRDGNPKIRNPLKFLEPETNLQFNLLIFMSAIL